MKHKTLKLYIIVILFTVCFSLVSSPCFAERYKTLSTVSMLIERGNDEKREILLQKRSNTGWMDGYWELAACGHVEEGETLKQAAVRETKEELRIDVEEKDLEFVGLNHNNISEKGIYYCVYFKVKNFSGVPKIGEPDKCEAIQWFPLDNLPQNIIPIRITAIKNYLNSKLYDECGWETNNIEPQVLKSLN